MSDGPQTETSYLIGNGWKPSPTTWCPDGGFEHPRLCRVPRAMCEADGVYDTQTIRMPKGVALIVQAVEEQAVKDELQERVGWIARCVVAVAESMGTTFARSARR